MNSSVLQDIDRRLKDLEQNSVRLRKAQITSDGVKLGDGDPAAGVTRVKPVDVGKNPPVLVGNNQAVVLGSNVVPILPKTSITGFTPLPGMLISYGDWVLMYGAPGAPGSHPWTVITAALIESLTGSVTSVATGGWATPTSPVSYTFPGGVSVIADITIGAGVTTVSGSYMTVSYSVAGGTPDPAWGVRCSGVSTTQAERTYRHVLPSMASISERWYTTSVDNAGFGRRLYIRPVYVGPP